MENQRTETARDHDDSATIDAIAEMPAQSGRAGGDLATDVATEDEMDRVRDPDSTTRVTKSDEIAHGTGKQSD